MLKPVGYIREGLLGDGVSWAGGRYLVASHYYHGSSSTMSVTQDQKMGGRAALHAPSRVNLFLTVFYLHHNLYSRSHTWLYTSLGLIPMKKKTLVNCFCLVQFHSNFVSVALHGTIF
jgi:hypothetical protein